MQLWASTSLLASKPLFSSCEKLSVSSDIPGSPHTGVPSAPRRETSLLLIPLLPDPGFLPCWLSPCLPPPRGPCLSASWFPTAQSSSLSLRSWFGNLGWWEETVGGQARPPTLCPSSSPSDAIVTHTHPTGANNRHWGSWGGRRDRPCVGSKGVLGWGVGERKEEGQTIHQQELLLGQEVPVPTQGWKALQSGPLLWLSLASSLEGC